MIYRDDGIPLIDSNLLSAIFRRHLPQRQTEIAFWTKLILVGVYLILVAMVTEAFDHKTELLDAGQVVTIAVVCAMPMMVVKWWRNGGDKNVPLGGTLLESNFEWMKKRRQVCASLTVMAENYIVKPASATKGSAASTMDDATDAKVAPPWKYDTEVWFKTQYPSGLNERKSTKVTKLFKVESLSEKKLEKKKTEEN